MTTSVMSCDHTKLSHTYPSVIAGLGVPGVPVQKKFQGFADIIVYELQRGMVHSMGIFLRGHHT